MKGGYTIIDFKDKNITVGGDAVVIDGIYDALERNYRKPTLCEHLTINNLERTSRFVQFGVDDSNYVGTFAVDGSVNVLTMTITADDEVTIVSQ